jgi:hypothetical protein
MRKPRWFVRSWKGQPFSGVWEVHPQTARRRKPNVIARRGIPPGTVAVEKHTALEIREAALACGLSPFEYFVCQ